MDKDQEFAAVEALTSSALMAKRLYRTRYKTDYTNAEVQQKLEAAGFQVVSPVRIRAMGIRPAQSSQMVANEDKVEAFDYLISQKLGEAITLAKDSAIEDLADVLTSFTQDVLELAATM